MMGWRDSTADRQFPCKQLIKAESVTSHVVPKALPEVIPELSNPLSIAGCLTPPQNNEYGHY